MVFRFIGLSVATLSFTATSRADLLQPGGRSGTVTAAGWGHNTGPGPAPTINQTYNIPSTGAGNISAAVYVNPFFTGNGTPPSGQLIGTDAATVNLNTVSGSSYSLSASASFGFTPGTSSDAVLLNPSYSFDQQIVVTHEVQYSLTMNVARPVMQSPGDITVLLPVPSESFNGPATSLLLSAPYYTNVQSPPNSGNFVAAPLTVSQIFTGILKPGTYSFDSSWTAPQIDYANTDHLSDNQTASVSASLSVSSVPEPTILGFVLATVGLLSRRIRVAV